MNMNDAFLGSLIFNKNGGGSDGHTIVDNEGVSLEQRTNLQFNGAYSEDNSTDDTTEVNVVREMTKAEFDLLSADEKVGFINITDITGGNDDRFQPVIYSEEEREIGVWTDGKPLYEKVFTLNQTTISSSWTNTAIDTTDIDIVASAFGIAPDGTFYSGLDGDPTASSHTVLKLRNYDKAYIVKLILQYTKISDTAGSGQWTPQGVPTHHYSTDEQIVGTWIDGSTLYERTLTTPTASITTVSGIASEFSLSGVENVEIVGGYVDIVTALLPLNFVMYEVDYNVFTYYDSANAKIINNVKGWTPTAFNIRVRYTKTST